MSLQYFGGNDLVHPLSEEEGAEIGYPRRSRKAGKARGSAEQRPAVNGGIGEIELESAALLKVRLPSDRDRIAGGSAGPGRANTGSDPGGIISADLSMLIKKSQR